MPYGVYKRKPWEELFHEKYFEDVYSGCFIWIGARTGMRSKRTGGYGNFRGQAAQRVAWKLKYGSIPEGLFVCHRCDNPACVNTEHLFIGSQQENFQDAVNKGRIGLGESHMHHKLTEESVREIKNSALGSRQLARKYGVARTTIGNIRKGKTWVAISP
jgi:hypothetical protein